MGISAGEWTYLGTHRGENECVLVLVGPCERVIRVANPSKG